MKRLRRCYPRQARGHPRTIAVTAPLIDAASALRMTSASGLSVDINANGSLRRFDHGAVSLLLFVGNEIEGGPANLYLRRLGAVNDWTPLLGPDSPTRFEQDPDTGSLLGVGTWQGIRYSLALVLAHAMPAWFWQVRLENTTASEMQVDLTCVQDLALASYGAVRMNEFYVSQYIDHLPLTHPAHGVVIASRQNQAADGKFPWCLTGSMRKAESFATDALQFYGLARRGNATPVGLSGNLPAERLQHEHSMSVIRDAPIDLAPHAVVHAGFFGHFVADHPSASADSDLTWVERVLALPEAVPLHFAPQPFRKSDATTLFAASPLPSLDLDDTFLQAIFKGPWRHEERDAAGARLSFFHGLASHVVLRAKELRVLRPHGHLLRTGLHLTPDESALTSTAWMNGVFHSMVTQGHVSINRFLSTIHSYLGVFRSHGLRVFAEIDGSWQLLDLPSAFHIQPNACHWIYRHATGTLAVQANADHVPQQLGLSVQVLAGGPCRLLISHHIAMNGDDGSAPGAALWSRDKDAILVAAAPDSDVGRRFPDGRFKITAVPGTRFERVGGDELLFIDGRSRQQPFVCIICAPALQMGLRIGADLVDARSQTPMRAASEASLIPTLAATVATAGPHSQSLLQLADIVPWFTHNALVHYLSPRGLEQYSGGGWGTRDVCQGPVEMLLALGRVEPIRDLLLRVMRTQNPDGDWPQWFMFFERERGIRPGDSHGDIVFWPLLVLAQYLLVSGDAGVLDERVPFFDSRGADSGEVASVWDHARRALALIEQRVIPGTALAAYGHGDWNDSLQPADPLLRERLCSSWTVTLNVQVLTTLACALRSIGRDEEAAPLLERAGLIRSDFQRLLVVDGVLTGYALFEATGVRYILHPRDQTTGVHYSSLAMIHALLEDMLTTDQIRDHLALMREHLLTPDGIRLFDRPMPYHGGPQRIFQRAESATFFGREIGLMYMHAHLRYAQALAHLGHAEEFFDALCKANPIGIGEWVPQAQLRQSNCYYSSSDAAFKDRDQASAEYERIAGGTIALEGGWRVYSSGAGIALSLIMRYFLGLRQEADSLILDPVIPPVLDGMSIKTTLLGRSVEVVYDIGAVGCGVTAIALNDHPIDFVEDANPHRRGAARASLHAVRLRLADGSNRLQIRIG